MKKIITKLLLISVFISAFSFSAFATNVNNTQKQFNKENEVIGKITSINSNSITVTLAERKEPDFLKNANGDRPEKPEFNGQNQTQMNGQMPPQMDGQVPPQMNGQKPFGDTQRPIGIATPNEAMRNINPEDMFTLTSTSKTYNITSAKFMSEKNMGQDGKYTDFKVGDYVAIEVENSTSTKAITVRSAIGGFGRGMRRNDNQNDLKPQLN